MTSLVADRRMNGLMVGETAMADYDIVIKGGAIIDGTRIRRYRCDIAVKDGRIVEIGRQDFADSREPNAGRGWADGRAGLRRSANPARRDLFQGQAGRVQYSAVPANVGSWRVARREFTSRAARPSQSRGRIGR